jgi:hypothetical protein
MTSREWDHTMSLLARVIEIPKWPFGIAVWFVIALLPAAIFFYRRRRLRVPSWHWCVMTALVAIAVKCAAAYVQAVHQEDMGYWGSGRPTPVYLLILDLLQYAALPGMLVFATFLYLTFVWHNWSKQRELEP